MQGPQDHDGLLTMTMKEILLRAKPIGAAISISSYQVLQDNHVFDILEPKHTEVHVLEDANGRTHLKGLSKVPSCLEFPSYCLHVSVLILHQPPRLFTFLLQSMD
jgi:kinesin family protein 22